MKRLDIDILLQDGEGTMLEYKENLSPSFARELVAMANTAIVFVEIYTERNS
jgi:ATP-dependent DNA helicase RecG